MLRGSVHLSVCHVLFVPGGQTSLTHRMEGQIFFSHMGGTNLFALRAGGRKFFVGGGGSYDDVDEEIDVSEANIFVSEASKPSAGDRIFRGP